MPFDAAISAEIWNAKYRFRVDGDGGDGGVEATWSRVAAAVAEAEPARARRHWRTKFETALTDFRFLPAGRIIAGAGTGRTVTLFNCFVMGTIPDNLDGIFEHLREAALTMQQGGGVGMDFSTIRPAGAPVRGVGAQGLGPALLHGRLGRHVPDGDVGRAAARRNDGLPAHRPSRHRGTSSTPSATRRGCAISMSPCW